MAKLLAAEVAHDATDQALQTYGGCGFDRQLGLLDDLLDTRLFRSAPVSQELTLNHIANRALRPQATARRGPDRRSQPGTGVRVWGATATEGKR